MQSDDSWLRSEERRHVSKKADPRLDGLGTIVGDVNILPSASLFTHTVGLLWVCGKRAKSLQVNATLRPFKIQ